MSTIREAIESSHEFAVLLSKWSMNRPWVLVELGMALSGTRRIVPILSGVGPERLLEILYIHGFTAVRYEKLDGYIGELARRVVLWRSAPGQTPRTERHLDGLRDQIEFAIRQWRGG